jgi:hypothetical protein
MDSETCVKVHLDGGSTARTPHSAAAHLGEVVVTERLRSSRTICWAEATRRAVLIDVVEWVGPWAMGQVVYLLNLRAPLSRTLIV